MADQISIQIAETVVSAGSAVTATVNFRTRATAAASTPATIRYRVDCLTTKSALVEWQSVSAASSATIIVPGTSNGIVAKSNETEKRQITVEIDTDLSTQARAAATWTTRNIRTFDGLFEFPAGLQLEPFFPQTNTELAAGVTPVRYQYPSYEAAGVVLATRHGFTGDGVSTSTADLAAISAALLICIAGATVDVLVTEAGFALGENSITVPEGVRLRFRGDAGLPLGKFATNGSLNGSSLPGMGMVILTSTTLPAIILRSNATIEGAMFWCPDQNWNITSLAESFTTYTAIQLGDATEPGPYHPNVIGCQFIGPTACVKQYATDGSSVKGGSFEHLTGVLMGDAFRIARSTDVLHFSDCHFTPNAVTNYVGDGAVGGDPDVFRAECAQIAKVFHFGKVDDFRAVDVFAFGVRNYAHWNNGFFTGDDNTGLGGTFIGGAADSCYQAFLIERSVTTIPINIVGGWFAPNFRPTGVAGDASSQAFMAFGASLTDLRINVVGVSISGGAVGEFPTDYSGQRDHDFVASAALSTGNNVLVTGFHSRNQNTGIVGAALGDIVTLGLHTLADVFQRPEMQTGYNTRSGGYYFNGTKVLGGRVTGWTAASGTATRSTFDTATVTTELLAQRVKALIDDLVAHGAIGS